MNSAERLKNLRERYHLSQNDVAKVLKVSPALISSYERGERTPSPQKLSSLADLYHTSTDYLLCRSNSYDDTLFIPVDGLTSRQIKLLRELIDTMKNN
ncbi:MULTISPECIES: helix-turn-helix domain-containing protein [Hungatella]|uniref:Helix-turn-helix domain-containing protein n=1 Tax=Hungatella hathewayi TaxID=154046 RepID=A0AAW9WQR1_9FIRM|nr:MULTISPECIES: helix-turn-helix transcriptional regulator [Hungatella]MCQ4832581.1 helix-turn-helix domain-containing protein [Hungatella sp. SL.1.14]MUB66717.1 helix-turn-helix domain-containing protein [Hungatella hathewayi]